MNKKMKRRLAVTSGIIVIVLIIVLAVVTGSSSAKSVTVAELSQGGYQDQKVQVSGTVVDNSFTTKNGQLSFDISDPDDSSAPALHVVYDKSASSTFGNGVTAICTGKIGADGALSCTELVTKCPSKYENASDALSVEKLLSYGDKVVDKTVKVAGIIQSGSLKDVTSEVRMVIADSDGGDKTLDIAYDGALPEQIAEGSSVIVTGSLLAGGTFNAAEIAQQG